MDIPASGVKSLTPVSLKLSRRISRPARGERSLMFRSLKLTSVALVGMVLQSTSRLPA
jgi:hypothetical protein